MSDETIPLTPAERAHRQTCGQPVKMGDGAEWLIPDTPLLRDYDRLRDRIYDEMAIQHRVTLDEIRPIAIVLLSSNYHITGQEAARLIGGADHQELADAVCDSLFGSGERKHRGWSAWARSSLRAAGLDPEKIPTAELHDVLAHLVASGRAIPQEEFIQSQLYAAGMRAMLGG